MAEMATTFAIALIMKMNKEGVMKRKGLAGLVLGVLFVFISCPLAWAQEATLNLNTT
jgi:hypothetical protein